MKFVAWKNCLRCNRFNNKFIYFSGVNIARTLDENLGNPDDIHKGAETIRLRSLGYRAANDPVIEGGRLEVRDDIADAVTPEQVLNEAVKEELKKWVESKKEKSLTGRSFAQHVKNKQISVDDIEQAFFEQFAQILAQNPPFTDQNLEQILRALNKLPLSTSNPNLKVANALIDANYGDLEKIKSDMRYEGLADPRMNGQLMFGRNEYFERLLALKKANTEVRAKLVSPKMQERKHISDFVEGFGKAEETTNRELNEIRPQLQRILSQNPPFTSMELSSLWIDLGRTVSGVTGPKEVVEALSESNTAKLEGIRISIYSTFAGAPYAGQPRFQNDTTFARLINLKQNAEKNPERAEAYKIITTEILEKDALRDRNNPSVRSFLSALERKYAELGQDPVKFRDYLKNVKSRLPAAANADGTPNEKSKLIDDLSTELKNNAVALRNAYIERDSQITYLTTNITDLRNQLHALAPHLTDKTVAEYQALTRELTQLTTLQANLDSTVFKHEDKYQHSARELVSTVGGTPSGKLAEIQTAAAAIPANLKSHIKNNFSTTFVRELDKQLKDYKTKDLSDKQKVNCHNALTLMFAHDLESTESDPNTRMAMAIEAAIMSEIDLRSADMRKSAIEKMAALEKKRGTKFSKRTWDSTKKLSKRAFRFATFRGKEEETMNAKDALKRVANLDESFAALNKLKPNSSLTDIRKLVKKSGISKEKLMEYYTYLDALSRDIFKGGKHKTSISEKDHKIIVDRIEQCKKIHAELIRGEAVEKALAAGGDMPQAFLEANKAVHAEFQAMATNTRNLVAGNEKFVLEFNRQALLEKMDKSYLELRAEALEKGLKGEELLAHYKAGGITPTMLKTLEGNHKGRRALGKTWRGMKAGGRGVKAIGRMGKYGLMGKEGEGGLVGGVKGVGTGVGYVLKGGKYVVAGKWLEVDEKTGKRRTMPRGLLAPGIPLWLGLKGLRMIHTTPAERRALKAKRAAKKAANGGAHPKPDAHPKKEAAH